MNMKKLNTKGFVLHYKDIKCHNHLMALMSAYQINDGLLVKINNFERGADKVVKTLESRR